MIAAVITLGFSTLLDLLSWIVVLALGLKALATIVLLCVDKEARYRPGWGAALWWTTKITPLIAVPCAIAIALLQGMTGQAWLFLAVMAFVVIAVPVKIRQRRIHFAQANGG